MLFSFCALDESSIIFNSIHSGGIKALYRRFIRFSALNYLKNLNITFISCLIYLSFDSLLPLWTNIEEKTWCFLGNVVNFCFFYIVGGLICWVFFFFFFFGGFLFYIFPKMAHHKWRKEEKKNTWCCFWFKRYLYIIHVLFMYRKNK